MKFGLFIGFTCNYVSGGSAGPLPDGADGAMYDPSVLSSLFQDAAGTIPVTSDGDPVGRMNDLSGGSYDQIQGTDAARPVYKTAGGLHWLQGDGAAHWMLCTTLALSNEWTHVGGWLANASQDCAFGLADSGNAALRSAAGWNWPDDGGTFVELNDGDRSTAHLASVVQRSDDVIGGWLIGVDEITLNPFETGGNSSLALFFQETDRFRRGLNGNFYGGVFVKGALTDGQRQTAEQWAAGKAGVTLSTPAPSGTTFDLSSITFDNISLTFDEA